MTATSSLCSRCKCDDRILCLAMDVRACLLVLLVSVASYKVKGATEGHGQLCRPTERFLSCGACQPTCKDPAPACVAVCRAGCFCKDGQVRNETGHCVELSQCPSVAPANLESSEPRHTDTWCPSDEEYRSCEPCNKTCDNPNPICPAQCARGCFCRDGLVRDKDGACVLVENCYNVKNNLSSNFVKPIALQLTCGPHQIYSHCKSCERVCSSSVPLCRSPCNAGCFCEDGYLKAPSGQCVKLEQCPRAEESLGGAQEPTIEDCSSDEIYLACGWCEPSCWEPNPECPRGVCTRGCLCRPPLLRHHSGHCVPQHECAPQKCSDPNEEFVCRYGCEARCDSTKCETRPRRCVLGCHCRLGLFRNGDGKCVSLNECPDYNQTYINNSNGTDTSSLFIYRNNNTVITFNLTDSKEDIEDKLFEDIPNIYIGVANIPALTSPDPSDVPKSVFDLPIDTSYSTNNEVKFKKAIADAKNTYTDVLSANNGDFYNVPSSKDLLDLANDAKRPRILSMLRAGRFFVDDKPAEPKIKNYMNDILMHAMKEIMPQALNLTFVNYNPLWSPTEQMSH